MNNPVPKHPQQATVHGLYSHQQRLQVLHDLEGKSWRYIAKNEDPYIGICHATLRRMYQGKAPVDPEICDRLHITRYLPAPACPRCGQVHTTKTCTANRKPAVYPKWVRVPGHAGWEAA